MEKLKEELDRLIATLPNEADFRQKLSDLFSVYPFNEYEYIISTLLAAEKLTFDEYLDLRDGYISRNRFLYIFEISAPRGFGEAWAQGHLSELVPDLVKPSKKLDKDYSGQYDFFLDGDNQNRSQGVPCCGFRHYRTSLRQSIWLRTHPRILT